MSQPAERWDSTWTLKLPSSHPLKFGNSGGYPNNEIGRLPVYLRGTRNISNAFPYYIISSLEGLANFRGKRGVILRDLR